MSTELKIFRDSLSHSFALFAEGIDVRNPERLVTAFNALLDHEVASFERRLADKEQLVTMSANLLEKPTPFPTAEEDDREVELQSPTLVIHPEPSVIGEKYEAPKTVPNEMFLGYQPRREPPPSPIASAEPEEEIEAEEVEDEEATEVVKIGKKNYHVGVTSRSVYAFIDDETMGEMLGVLRNGKISPQ
jgi:hypothetical protein